MSVFMYVCIYVCICMFMYEYMYLCKYVCLYVCICMYVCMYVYMYVFIHSFIHSSIYTAPFKETILRGAPDSSTVKKNSVMYVCIFACIQYDVCTIHGLLPACFKGFFI